MPIDPDVAQISLKELTDDVRKIADEVRGQKWIDLIDTAADVQKKLALALREFFRPRGARCAQFTGEEFADFDAVVQDFRVQVDNIRQPEVHLHAGPHFAAGFNPAKIVALLKALMELLLMFHTKADSHVNDEPHDDDDGA